MEIVHDLSKSSVQRASEMYICILTSKRNATSLESSERRQCFRWFHWCRVSFVRQYMSDTKWVSCTTTNTWYRWVHKDDYLHKYCQLENDSYTHTSGNPQLCLRQPENPLLTSFCCYLANDSIYIFWQKRDVHCHTMKIPCFLFVCFFQKWPCWLSQHWSADCVYVRRPTIYMTSQNDTNHKVNVNKSRQGKKLGYKYNTRNCSVSLLFFIACFVLVWKVLGIAHGNWQSLLGFRKCT